MIQNKIFSLFAILFLLGGCSHSNFYDKVVPEFGIETNISPYEIKDTKNVTDENYFKMHGRYYFDESLNVNFFNFSNSGFEVTFKGTTLEGYFYTTKADDDKNRPYLGVSIDNDYDPDKAIPIQLTSTKYSNSTKKENNYFVHEHVVLAHDLEDKEHTIRIYKRSECLISKVGIKSVSCDGEILKVKSKDLPIKMEFYGDSVTCGYAVESDDYYERFSSRTENSMKSYANYCANILNADVSLISCGGYPMYQSIYAEGCSPSNIPEMISLSDVEYQTQSKHIWDNSKYIPDVVVVALGANDGSKLKKEDDEFNKEFVNKYKETYLNFISKLQQLYIDPLIVVSDEILPINNLFSEAMDEIVVQLNNPKVIRAKYNAYEKANNRTLPGEGHPNVEMQKLAGGELANLLKTYLL